MKYSVWYMWGESHRFHWDYDDFADALAVVRGFGAPWLIRRFYPFANGSTLDVAQSKDWPG